VIDAPWRLAFPNFSVVLAILGLALLCTAFAYVLYFAILKRAGATNLVLVTFLAPVSAILLGIALLGEHLALQHVLGLLAIAFGLALIDGRLVSFASRAL
jgi:drug/metabolite transporter (DMT)-like permease